MKRVITLFTILALLSNIGNSQNLRAYFSYSVFNTPENEPYVETYLTINGASLNYIKLDDGSFQSTVDVQLLFKKGDSIMNYAKYDLDGPVVTDTALANQNMLDVQRYGLPEGEYSIELSLQDKNGNEKKLTTTADISIDFSKDGLQFSDIELLSSYEKSDAQNSLSKNGYLLTPYVFNYYPESMRKVSFYTELYNSKEVMGDKPFLLTNYIRPFETDKKLDQYIHRKKVTPNEVVTTLSSFEISELPSGNYLLVTEARNRNNEVIAQKEIFFQRYNPSVQYSLTNLLVMNTANTFVEQINSRDTLEMYIDYLEPISTNIEKLFTKNQVATATDDELRKYFLNFWTERNRVNPEESWDEYHLRVMQANQSFTSVSSEGYKSDRGRVYLQYGQPNVISDSHFEPAAYPYEIWHYYKLENQNDKKFVFYTHDNVTNDFQLIHSNALGELSNYRWQAIIYRRTWDPNSLDDAIIPSTYGSNATKNYIQPW